jgi:hypothetical protein
MRYRRWLQKADMPTPKLTNEIISAAILGFEQQKTHIDAKIAKLRALLPGGPAESATTPEAPTRKRKKFSAAARRKMALAQKARWVKIEGESEPPATAAAPKAKRKMSNTGRAAIVAATKKRWDAVHKAQKAATKAVPAKKKMSAARKAALVANLAKARAARAAERSAGGKVPF